MATDTSEAGALWDAGVRNPLVHLRFRVRVYPDRFFTGGEDEGYFTRNAGIHRFESCREKTSSRG